MVADDGLFVRSRIFNAGGGQAQEGVEEFALAPFERPFERRAGGEQTQTIAEGIVIFEAGGMGLGCAKSLALFEAIHSAPEGGLHQPVALDGDDRLGDQ